MAEGRAGMSMGPPIVFVALPIEVERLRGDLLIGEVGGHSIDSGAPFIFAD